jgi:polysaccharide deacetylase 2 family uncharacterized protein YibQ
MMMLRGERLRGSSRPAPGDKRRGDAPLATAWLLLMAAVAVTVAWLLLKAEDTEQEHPNLRAEAVLLQVEPRLAPEMPMAESAPAETAPPAAGENSTMAEQAPPGAEPPAVAEPAPPQQAAAPVASTAEAAHAPAENGPSAHGDVPAVEADADMLIPAPDPALVEETPLGPMPRIGADGRVPWRVYARPFDGPEKAPKVAIVLTGLGLSYNDTRAALDKLPGGVTFSFDPYTDSLQQWIAVARAHGHEVLIDLPLEPINYPQSDPGPQTLLLGATAADNQARLDWVLTRGSGYVGVASAYGGTFSGAVNAMLPVLQILHRRGLVYVDNHIAGQALPTRLARDIGVPLVTNDRYLDAEGTRGALDVRLGEIERQARSAGHAVGFAAPHPTTIDRLAEWLKQLEAKKILLAPATAMIPK